jgi:hypothetical protein
MGALRDYRELHGLSREQLADELTEALGRPVKPSTIANYESRSPNRLPKSWQRVLTLAGPSPSVGIDEPAAWAGDPVSSQSQTGVREGEPPRPPDGVRPPTAASVSAGPSGEFSMVRDRIAKAYSAIGAGASMLTQNNGYSAVADAYSNDLARAWVAAAQENQNVKRIVEFMESGGPVGELVVAHLILVGGFVYVSGRGPALDFLYQGKFGGYRSAAAQQIAESEAAESSNGSAAFDSARLVGEPPS